MKIFGRIIPTLMGKLMKKPDTIMYPTVHAKVPERFRGALEFDPEKCVGCKMCQRVCPSNAIEIEKVGDKRYKAVVRMDKCIFCGQCVDSCIKAALKNTNNFELASTNKHKLKVDI
jgi:formate hydrogenlyase subunit 6/NADH:ubiquinone oxidoreductase subunit I